MGLLFQILGTGIISTLGINMGLIFAWPASVITLFASPNTTLHRPMTDTEISLLGSLSSVGAIISTLLAGLYLDKLGRKKCSILVSLCMLISWLLLTVSRRVEVVLTSIFISGIGSAVFLIGSIYLSEICQESIRGAMTAANMVSYSLGMLLSYIFGGYLSYDIMLYLGLTQSAMGCCLLFMLKDSPSFLMHVGMEKEAAQAIAFFRRVEVTDNEVIKEMSSIKRALNPEFDECTPEHEKLQNDLKPVQKLSFWQFMKKSQSSRRAFIITMVLMTASMFQGLVVVQLYVEVLFEQAVPSISPALGSIIMAFIGVISGILTGYICEALGRRPLMIHTSNISGIICILLGTQLQCNWAPNWTTALFLYLFISIFTLGAGTVPFILTAELFLPEVKSIVSMITIEWGWLCNFVILFIFNPLLKAIGWGPVFYIFATVCVLTGIYSAIFLPETKGLDVNEIQVLLTKKNKKNYF